VGFYKSKPVVIDINASHKARGLVDRTPPTCAFCSTGLETHCPDRVSIVCSLFNIIRKLIIILLAFFTFQPTLGINQLPGGLAPYAIVPKNAIKYIPENLSLVAAVLTEPFSAAIHVCFHMTYFVQLTPVNVSKIKKCYSIGRRDYTT
jgi:threonine dehydrogenase-like Zn-dependent dehydrogenase